MNPSKLPIITAVLCILLVPVISIGWVFIRMNTTAPTAHVSPITPEAVEEYERDLPWKGIAEEVTELMKDIQTKKIELEKRELSVMEREDRIAAEVAELNKVRLELVTLRKTIESMTTSLTATESDNLKPMVQMCSNLSPKSAIALLKEMPPDTSIKILRLMKEDVVTAILEEMTKGAKEGSEPVVTAAQWLEKLRLVKDQSK